ncbi:PorP/SprF family type IX secretion system membrane protein [Rubrolithibacter danxiaensis]|uniref:PorP/SprF family type IX secretion system membrane protein n=1 Tax=Rubrolithibacter danxiaensis TaxID=3390805 RepID=UPI003BF7CDF0
MKRLFGFLFLLLSTQSITAQQRPQYTQYIFNNYLLNPALSGIESYIDVKGGYRNQWNGLDGAPVTTYISVNAPIGRNFIYSNANSFSSDGNNPMNRSYVQSYMAAEPHHGVGMHAVIDKAGPISRTDLNITYAYHLGLSEQVNFAVGVAAGISKINLDVSKISVGDPGSIDPAITGESSQLKPDLGAGIWLYGPRFFAGISGQQLLGQKLTFGDESSSDPGKLSPHFFTTAGYKLFMGENIAAIPSLMVKFVSPAPVSFDTNVKLAFQDKFWLGGSYRVNDSFAAMAGFNLSHLFNFSYSYDFTTSELKSVSRGSHEIVLGLLLNNHYKVTCPQHQF